MHFRDFSEMLCRAMLATLWEKFRRCKATLAESMRLDESPADLGILRLPGVGRVNLFLLETPFFLLLVFGADLRVLGTMRLLLARGELR